MGIGRVKGCERELATRFAKARDSMSAADLSALRKCIDDQVRRVTEVGPASGVRGTRPAQVGQ